MSISLVGDFGGTNARLAISGENGIENVKEYRCSDFQDPSEIIKKHITSEGLKNVNNGLFAVAGAAENPQAIIFTNGPWKQKAVDFTDTQIEETTTINDFDAVCYSIAALKPEEATIISEGRQPFYPSLLLSDPETYTDNSKRLLMSDPSNRFVTIGPGTGLGVSSGLVTNSGQFLVLGGEGGHADFAADTPEELELKDYFESKDIIVTRETIASGTGLAVTYNAICEIRELDAHIENASGLAEQLSRNKPKAVREAARWTLKLFAETLGKCAASTALTNDARTVFIAGGVIPKLGENFYKNAFARTFHDNDLGANNELKSTPVVLITHPQPGLLGAHSFLKLQKT